MSSSHAQPPWLLDQTHATIRLRHSSYGMENCCVQWIERLIPFYDEPHLRDIGGTRVTAYLSNFGRDRKVTAGTENQAPAAPLFM